MTPADILIVDDEADIRDTLADILHDEGFTARTASCADSAFREINARQPDLIILDIWLQGSRKDGIEVLKVVKRDNPDLPVVIISGHGNIELAVTAIQQGAYDFVEKPFNTEHLLVIVARAIEAARLRRENAAFRERESRQAELIGASPALQQLRHTLDRVAPTNSRVMIFGPPGSGKEVAARYLHSKSRRVDGPFVVVNAANMEPERIEESLFGRERDGGGLPIPGLMEAAHGGTIFFDEVADMPRGAQSKILRVLVDQAFARVGGADTVRVDVRVISATSKQMRAEIDDGRFREDLFHRLNVVPVDSPSLSMRREDIPALADYFIDRLSREQGLSAKTLTGEALATLQTHDWPGNIRQLKNLIERMMILGGESEITPEDLPSEIRATSSAALTSAGGESLVAMSLRDAREAFEREYLMAQISRFGGNVSRTASFIGMERSALHRKLKALGVATSARAARGDNDEMERAG